MKIVSNAGNIFNVCIVLVEFSLDFCANHHCWLKGIVQVGVFYRHISIQKKLASATSISFRNLNPRF